MKFFFALVGLLGLLSSPAWAAEPNRIYVGLGTVLQNMAKISASPKATVSPFGEVYLPEVVVGYSLEKFFPTLGWTILGNKTNDGNKRRSLLRLDLPYLFPLPNNFQAKAGVGFLIYRIYGDSATVTLRNGGATSSFYVPGGARSSRLFYVGGGAAWDRGKWRADLDLFVAGLLTTKRSFNASLRGGYVF